MLSAILPLLGRLVVTPTSPPVTDVAEREVLFLKREAYVDTCAPDAGIDAGSDDAGLPDAGTDAGTTDAGIPDAGAPDGGSCGLELIKTISMIVQPELGFLHDDSDFALLYVTPTRPQVTEQSRSLFHDLRLTTAPMIETEIVYVEDASYGTTCAKSGGCGAPPQQQEQTGCGGSYDYSPWSPPSITDAGTDDGDIAIENVGPYEIVRVQPATRQQLATWLDDLGYTYKAADLDAVEPYIGLGYHVVAVRLRADTTMQIARRMIPLAFTYVGDEIRIPAALGRHETDPLVYQSLTVYVGAERRYEFPGAGVDFAMPTGSHYLTKNEIVLDQGRPASEDPVATGSCCVDFRATRTITETKHVPKTVYCDEGDEGFGCGDCSTGSSGRQTNFALIAVGLLFALRRRQKTTA